MSDNDPIQEARQFFSTGDVSRGSKVIHRLLKRDITDPEAWELLYETIGGDQPFDEFQRTFVQSYYPGLFAEFLIQKERNRRPLAGEGPFRRVSLVSSDTGPQEKPAPTPIDFPHPKTGPLPDLRRMDPEPPREPFRLSNLFSRFKPGSPSERAEKSPKKVKQSQPEKLPDRDAPKLWERSSAFPPARTPDTAPSPAPVDGAEQAPAAPKPAGSGLIRNLPRQHPTDKSPAEKPRLAGQPLLVRVNERAEIRILIADDIPQTRENIRKLLLFEPTVEVVGVAANGQEAIDQAIAHAPDIVLLDVNMPDMDGLVALKQIRAQLPNTQVVMLTVQDDPGYLREALQLGARDYLIKPPTIDDLLLAIRRAFDAGKLERERLEKLVKPPDVDLALSGSGRRGHAVAVYSPKGGVGCSMIAANLAVTLQSLEDPVVLVDCHFPFGTVGLFFNEAARNSVADLAGRVKELDRHAIEQATMLHGGSGVRLLLAPPRPEQAGHLTGEQLSELIEVLRSAFAYIVVDTSTVLDGQMVSVLQACDRILLVSTQDIPAIHDLRRTLDYAPSIGIEPERFSLVLNQYHARIRITPEQIGTNLRREIAAVIPLDSQTTVPSINRGMPFMVNASRRASPIGQAIQTLADHVRTVVISV